MKKRQESKMRSKFLRFFCALITTMSVEFSYADPIEMPLLSLPLKSRLTVLADVFMPAGKSWISTDGLGKDESHIILQGPNGQPKHLKKGFVFTVNQIQRVWLSVEKTGGGCAITGQYFTPVEVTGGILTDYFQNILERILAGTNIMCTIGNAGKYGTIVEVPSIVGTVNETGDTLLLQAFDGFYRGAHHYQYSVKAPSILVLKDLFIVDFP